MTRRRIGLLAFALAAALSGAAVAQAPQTSNYSTVEAIPGKPVELGYHATARKNCSPAPLPTIRVIEAPRSGVLTVRKGELTTSRVAGCPKLKTPVQVVLYEARAGQGGTDHVIYEVTSVDGEVSRYDVTIKIGKASPAPGKGKEI